MSGAGAARAAGYDYDGGPEQNDRHRQISPSPVNEVIPRRKTMNSPGQAKRGQWKNAPA